MKKYFLLVAVFASISLASCSNSKEENKANNESANTENATTAKKAADYARELYALLKEFNNCSSKDEEVLIVKKMNALAKEVTAAGLEAQVTEELKKLGY